MNADSLTLVDAHAHFHRCFAIEDSLDAAVEHFEGVARGLPFSGVLMLAEPRAADAFASLCIAEPSRWKIEDCGDRQSRRARRRDGATLLLVAGFQVQTGEGLEVLCLGCTLRPADGDPIARVVRAARDAGGIAVIPWGAGKWLGRRGVILSELIESVDDPGFFLGDNAGRPAAWRPRHFERASSRGIRILPGTDPLPFASESRRLGANGFRLSASLSSQHAGRELIDRLEQPDTNPVPFGRSETPLRFVRNQLAMQWQMHVVRRR